MIIYFYDKTQQDILLYLCFFGFINCMPFSHVCVDMGSCVAAIEDSVFLWCLISVVYLFSWRERI